MIMTGGNQRTQGKTCPTATLSTTKPTQPAINANPGLYHKMLATNHLSYGMAYNICLPSVYNKETS
jgi:hypothetical protein